jgi:NAD(P)-dependent dehydrogenase (short-subunit alcohol dehydrogenase family)
MTGLLDGKVVLITGGRGRDIGTASAKLLAIKGTKVMLASRTRVEREMVMHGIA